MHWLWESITVPRILLWFLFGVGIAYILDTCVRLFLPKHPNTVNKQADNGDKHANQEEFKPKTVEVNLRSTEENIIQQENVSDGKNKSDYCHQETKDGFHAQDSSTSLQKEQPKENFTTYIVHRFSNLSSVICHPM
jgi:hypothetical protein